MKIVFNMDNSLFDELGKTPRPGIRKFLEKLIRDGHRLVLWTSSRRKRTEKILSDRHFTHFFSEIIFGEDYDPKNEGLPKDIRKIDGDMLIDADPKQIEFVKSIKIKGILISTFRGGSVNPGELNEIYQTIQGNKKSFWGRLKSKL